MKPSKTALLLSVLVLSALANGYAFAAENSQGGRQATELVLLGTAAGRTSWRGSPLGGPSSALKIGNDVYVVDFGRNWLDRYYAAGLASPGKPSSTGGLQNMRAGFITHLHGDHIVGLARLVLLGASDGLAKRQRPVQIFGPGPRGELIDADRVRKEHIHIVSPDHPEPGTEAMFHRLFEAYATDLNDNIVDSGMPPPSQYLSVHDIDIPRTVNASPSNPSPKMKPFLVYQDENVKVSAILNHHGAVYPSFAYRFDTANGSIVFSGDTNFNQNVTELASDADILVHEVIDGAWAKAIFPKPRTSAQTAKLNHLLGSHTDLRKVAKVARQAGAKLLVLSHVVPITLTQQRVEQFATGFSGKVVLGRPLMSWALRKGHIQTNPAPNDER